MAVRRHGDAACADPGRSHRRGRNGSRRRPTLDAKVELTSALRELGERNDSRGQARAHLLLGMVEVSLGNTDAARAALQEATSLLQAKNDVLGAWTGLVNLAHLEKGLGLFTAALARQREALDVVQAAKMSTAPLSLETFVHIAPAFGLPSEAFRLAPVQASYLKAIFLHSFCEPLTRDGYASLLIEVGEYERAEEELHAAASGVRMFASLYEHTFAAHEGDLRFRQGRFDEARVSYRKALSGTLRLPLSFVPEQSIRLGIHKRMTELELATGRGDEALQWSTEALDVARNTPGNRWLELSFLEDRGLPLVRLNRVSEAEDAYAEASRVASELRNRSRQASIEANWGGLHLLTGNYCTAAAHMETAIELYQVLNDPVSEAVLWTTIAEVHILTGTDATADKLLARARQLADASRYSVAGDLISVIECWRQSRKGTATADYVRTAVGQLARNPQLAAIDAGRGLERFLRSMLALEGHGSAVDIGARAGAGVPALSSFAHAIEARRQFQQGNVELARELWTKAFESNVNREVHAGSAAAIGMTFWREGNAASAIRWLTEAAKVLEVTIDDLHAETMLAGFFGNERRAYYDVLVEMLLHDGQVANGNGLLTVADIQAEIDLTGVNLVVLSAYRSGVGKRSVGDEVVGLTRAILHAGSPGVISTLWNINDEATPPLIEKFYDRLMAGAPAADALRGAQVELLRESRYADPYYWAAFLMTGDPAGKWQPGDK